MINCCQVELKFYKTVRIAMVQNMKLKQGEAVREFYAALPVIEEYYSIKGYRKITYLYEVLQPKLGWQMSLRTFRYHINKHIADGVFVATPKVKKRVEEDLKIEVQKESPKKEESNDGSPIAKANFRVGKRFNPHTVDIPKERIL